MREHLRSVQAFLKRTHTEINSFKCRALQLTLVPGTKRNATHTKPRYHIDGIYIPAFKIQEQLKYLGHNYSQYGMTVPSIANLENVLKTSSFETLAEPVYFK